MRRCDYTAKNAMMTNQRRRKNKLRESEYRGAVCGVSAVAIQGRRVQITVNRVLRARGKMLRGKSNGPADCLVVEMLSRLPTEVIYEVTHWFQKRFEGVFLKKPDARLEKGLRGFGAIALLSVFSKCYTTVLVDLLHEEKEPIEWMSLHVGAERGVNCEHMQRLLTNLLQKHGERQENRRSSTIRCTWQAWMCRRRLTWPSRRWCHRFFL